MQRIKNIQTKKRFINIYIHIFLEFRIFPPTFFFCIIQKPFEKQQYSVNRMLNSRGKKVQKNTDTIWCTLPPHSSS